MGWGVGRGREHVGDQEVQVALRLCASPSSPCPPAPPQQPSTPRSPTPTALSLSAGPCSTQDWCHLRTRVPSFQLCTQVCAASLYSTSVPRPHVCAQPTASPALSQGALLASGTQGRRVGLFFSGCLGFRGKIKPPNELSLGRFPLHFFCPGVSEGNLIVCFKFICT